MDILTKQYGDVVILSINGRLDDQTVPQFYQAMNAYMAEGCRLVADLKKVDILSEAGIEALRAAARQVQQQGGELRIAHPQMQVKVQLNLAGVCQDIPTFSHVIAATVSYFSQG